MKYLIYILLLFSTATQAQIVAVIFDFDNGHAITVQDEFEQAYGCTGCSHIISNNDPEQVKTYIIANPSVEIVIRSTNLYYNYTDLSKWLWERDKLLTMPYGANSFIEGSDRPKGFTLIIGAGGNQNQTMYGSQLDVWATSPRNPVTATSYANALIAANILQIKEATNRSMEEVVYAVKVTASNRLKRTDTDGYGRIQPNEAIALLSQKRVSNLQYYQNLPLVFSEGLKNEKEYEILTESDVDNVLNKLNPTLKSGYLLVDLVTRAANTTIEFDTDLMEVGDIIELRINSSPTRSVILTNKAKEIRTVNFSSDTYFVGASHTLPTNKYITATLMCNDENHLLLMYENGK